MGFRFSKRIGRSRRSHVNIGKKSASVSLGKTGGRLTVGTRGLRGTVGIPGTGISYTTTLGSRKRASRKRTPLEAARAQADFSGTPMSTTAIILWLVFFFPVGLPLTWTRSTWTDDTKWAVSGLFFWPLWWRFIRSTTWDRRVKGAVALALLVGYGLVFTPASGVAIVVIGVPGFVWAMRSRNSAQPIAVSDFPATEYREAEETLRAADALVVSIEDMVALDVEPMPAAVAAIYREALETRERGARLLRTASSSEGLRRASRTLRTAVSELRSVERAVAGPDTPVG